MNPYKYILTGVVGLFFTLIAAFYITNVSFGNDSSLLKYFPKKFDQVAYFNVNKGFKDFLSGAGTSGQFSGDIKEVLFSLEEAGVYQYYTGGETKEFMLFKVGDNFDKEKATNIGFIKTGGNYTYERIEGKNIVYGKNESVEYFKENKDSNIENNEKISSYIDEVKSGEKNVLMLTNPNSKNVQVSDTVKSYLQFMDYGVVTSNISTKNSNAKLQVLLSDTFKQNFNLNESYSFSSSLGKFSSKSDYLFLEIGSLLDLVNISKGQVQSMLNGVASNYMGGSSSVLTQSDFSNISGLLEGNIALKLGKASNILNLGGAIVFENENLYDTLYKLFPFTKNLVNNIIESNKSINTENFNLNYIDKNNKFGVSFTAPYLKGALETRIVIEKIDGKTVINLMNIDLKNTSKNVNLSYEDDSVLAFYLSPKNIASIVKSYSAMAGFDFSFIQKNYSFLLDKNVKGYLSLNNDKVTLKFKLLTNEQ